jgi:hypothetical protein
VLDRCQTKIVRIRIILSTLGLLFAPSTISFPCLAQTQVEMRNEEGLKGNPAGVNVVLRTKDGRSTFHLFETIPVELDFSSSTPSTYSVELDETMNFAGSANRFEVSSDDSVFLTLSQIVSSTAVCCASNKRYLSQKALTLKRELTDYLRFEKPGTYSLFFITNRVFRNLGKKNDFGPSDLTITSNLLTLTILPDDPEWDSQQLDSSLRKLRDPHVNANYLATVRRAKQRETEIDRDFAMTNVVSQTELVTAQKSLNVLDTDDAIHQRVKMMQMESKEDLEMTRKFDTGSVLSQPLLASTTRAEFLEATLRERAEDPEFGVDYDYGDWWIRFLVQRDHPELFRPTIDDLERQKRARDFSVHYGKAELTLLSILESVVQNKKGEAQKVTASTIKVLRLFSSSRQ